MDIDVESGYLYATDTVYNLRVFNAAEPVHLVEVGTEHGSSNRVIVAGDYAYVNTWDSPWQANVRIVSIADKANPVEVGSLGTSNQCPGFDVAGDYLYVVDTWWGLCVYSLADKSNPAQVGSYAPSQSVWDVTVEGDYAYLTTFSSLLVVSVADKGQPAEVGSWSWPSVANEIFVQGDYAYVGTGSGLYVVSIADKSHLAEVGSLIGLSIYGLDVDGDYVYASTSNDGLVVIDVADKSHPTEVGRYAVPRASTVRKVGDAVYLACGQKGLYVLREHDAATAHIPPSGGSLTSPDGSVTVQVPPGAISATITLTFTHQSPSFTGELAGADRFFDLTAVYSDTNEPAQVVSGTTYTVTVSYPAAGPAIESTLGLYWWDGDAWSTQGLSSSVNTSAGVVTAQVGHFSRFAVLGETRRVYLPVVWRGYP